MPPSPRLPVESLRADVLSALEGRRVVVTSPTGSGKSTVVPRWCRARGRVLVVEPRRVACRSLAARVAELEGCRLGGPIGYTVRDDNRSCAETRLLFATPGVVLRLAAEPGRLERYGTIVLDEFHERSLDVDLLLALFLERFPGALVVMSATLDGDRVARHVDGVHLHAEGRVFPVERRHLAGETLLPDVRGVEARVLAGLEAARSAPGDVLVFLPGKGEIAGVERALSGRAGLDVIPLHGGLTLREQGRAFLPSSRRKVVLATNVAETSITLPGVGVVLDSGLVRRTRYHEGRGFLTLSPVALDSADQRAGRAGRTTPGICWRLWSEAARLEATTPPEIHRESLVPLVLAAAACDAEAEALPFLDPPKEHALESACEDLCSLGVLDAGGHLTERGRRVFGLPLDAHLGRLLVEAEAAGCLADMIDLVGALATDRPLFAAGPRPERREDDLRDPGCDAVALIRAVRAGRPRRHGLSSWALGEARSVATRLRRAWSLPKHTEPDDPIDRRRLALTALAADPRCAHVARRRKKRVAWGNGGTELELGRESAVNPDEAEAIAVLATRALGVGHRDTRILCTAAMPVTLRWLLDAGLGRDRLAGAVIKRGRLLARVQRVYARRVLETREEVPAGALAREAIRDRFLAGALFPETLRATRERLEAAALWERLRAGGLSDGLDEPWEGGAPVPPPEEWVLARLETLGVETGDDLELLSPDDLLAPDLPATARSRLDREFPREVSVGDAAYRVRYDLARREVTLEKVRGSRTELPPLAFLPAFHGFRLLVRHKSAVRVLRD